MAKLTDVTGAVRTSGKRSSVPTTDVTGKSVDEIVSYDSSETAMIAKAENREENLELPFVKKSAPENPFVQGSPLKPDPNIFKFDEVPATTEIPTKLPLRGMSEIVNAVRSGKELSPIPSPLPDQRERPRRLTHNEMLEQIIGASGVSNQTKFYVIAKLGYHEETGPKDPRTPGELFPSSSSETPKTLSGSSKKHKTVEPEV